MCLWQSWDTWGIGLMHKSYWEVTISSMLVYKQLNAQQKSSQSARIVLALTAIHFSLQQTTYFWHEWIIQGNLYSLVVFAAKRGTLYLSHMGILKRGKHNFTASSLPHVFPTYFKLGHTLKPSRWGFFVQVKLMKGENLNPCRVIHNRYRC